MLKAQAPQLSRRLDVLRSIDHEVHAELRAVLPVLVENGIEDDELAALVDLLCQTCTEEREGTLGLIERLDGLMREPVNVTALRQWALDGLQRYRNEPLKRQRHFVTGDPIVFADRAAETAAGHWVARRAALQYYLAGFGFADFRFELHAPHNGAAVPARATVGDELLLAPRRWHGVLRGSLDQLHRAAVAHAAAHLRFSPRQRLGGSRRPMLLAMISLIEDARVERLMVQLHPGLHALWGRFHVATRADAGFDLAGLSARLARALHDPGYEDGNDWVMLGRQLFEEAAADLHDIAVFERIGRRLAIRVEKMRLPFGATSDRWLPSYRDDNTLLWNLNAALPEDEQETSLTERFELRTPPTDRPPTRQAEVDMRRHSHYPEWDFKLEALRENWATVVETVRPSARAAPLGRPGRALRGRIHSSGLARIPDRALRLKRLHEGDELDLGAIVDSVVQRRSEMVPDPRIFMRHGRQRRSTAIVLLMDLSESTQRFVPGSFTSVLDVEKRAVKVVAESLDESRDRVAVHGFSSDGRHAVHYLSIKGFDEPFGPEQRARLQRLEGRMSTRMGAALRHASEALCVETAERKVILLLTDGEPSDVDVFEDDYLVEDARHAVTSAAACGIHTFCLTLDRQADGYVRRIFGSRNYLIADRAGGFSYSTGQVLGRLIVH